MGYISDLYVKATNDVAPQIYQALIEVDLLNECDFQQDEDYFYVTLIGLKWYDSYDDVKRINTLIHTLGKENKATMIRVGEDSGDIETYGTDPDTLNLYYYTNVELDGFLGDTGLPILRQSNPELFI